MKIRRCAVLYIEPREALVVDWAGLFSGGGALSASLTWTALAPHIGIEIEVDSAEVQLLGSLGHTAWTERSLFEQRFAAAAVARLLGVGLLLGDSPEHAAMHERDLVLRSQHWRPLSALAHTFSRWQGVGATTGLQTPSFQDLVDQYGPPPPPVIARTPPELALQLPPAASGALDQTLFARYTGRNFDSLASLPMAVVARLLQRSFGAQEWREVGAEGFVLKKLSPSAGALHPIEAYVLAQRIDGVAPGLYHYHTVNHALEPLALMQHDEAAALALKVVADQHWFADAPMLVIMAARVERNFWKYRNHFKAYKAIVLDAGHLSQTFYLLATEAGLPAFITAAVNEIDIEAALGLDHLCDAVMAVCGCGVPAAAQATVELRYGHR